MPEQNEREKYISDLNKQLETIMAAQSFQQTEGGKLIIQMLKNDINVFTQDLISSKFINDHNGYLDVRSRLEYAASLLGRIITVADPEKEKKARQDLKLAKTSDDDPEGNDSNGA